VQKRELFIAYALQLLYDYNNLGLGVEGLPKSAVAPIPAVINTGLAVVTKDNVSTIKVGS
jgi:hypothetical protein